MLDKFILNYEGQEIKTQKGLVQGSVLSLVLFNLYINDLMWNLEFEKIKSWAYYNDITWVWESIDKTKQAIEIVNKWAFENKMIINPQKSRIMRVLLRRSKCKGISNSIDIPEIDSYCYLGVNITQSLRLDDHELKMRKFEQFLNRRIWILLPSMLLLFLNAKLKYLNLTKEVNKKKSR